MRALFAADEGAGLANEGGLGEDSAGLLEVLPKQGRTSESRRPYNSTRRSAAAFAWGRRSPGSATRT